MAVAKSNSIDQLLRYPSCYKVEGLNQTILDVKHTSNLKDRYIIGEQLGWGQFGVISLCSDKLTGEVLACKSIAKDRLVTTDDARSVKLEIEIMTRLSGHPNVVDLKAVYEDENYVHLVMELCAGGELFHQLEKRGRFSEVEARVLFRHLMQVVSYCHEAGVVHRDLKPENILLATRASSSPIKLADFGLATYIKPGQSLHGTVGSPFYIAPEVLAGGYNQAADVWSAGVILYILLSGMPPFWGKTKSQIFDAVRAADLQFPSDPWDNISELAKDLVKGMLCTDSTRRLTAQQALDHSWVKDVEPYPEESSECGNQSCGEWALGGGSFSTFMSRNQDISFDNGSPIPCDVPSPTFTCRSSFSSLTRELSTHFFASGGFSFCGGDNAKALQFSSPVSSMPSFSFLSSHAEVDQGSCALDFSTSTSRVEVIHGEANLEKLFMLLEPSQHIDGELENKLSSAVKKSGGTVGSKTSCIHIHGKRNHTIGLGEREQLDLIVSESVIRWASCTHLPTAPALRSSLVC